MSAPAIPNPQTTKWEFIKDLSVFLPNKSLELSTNNEHSGACSNYSGRAFNALRFLLSPITGAAGFCKSIVRVAIAILKVVEETFNLISGQFKRPEGFFKGVGTQLKAIGEKLRVVIDRILVVAFYPITFVMKDLRYFTGIFHPGAVYGLRNSLVVVANPDKKISIDNPQIEALKREIVELKKGAVKVNSEEGAEISPEEVFNKMSALSNHLSPDEKFRLISHMKYEADQNLVKSMKKLREDTQAALELEKARREQEANETLAKAQQNEQELKDTLGAVIPHIDQAQQIIKNKFLEKLQSENPKIEDFDGHREQLRASGDNQE